jgi:hypothetical protein
MLNWAEYGDINYTYISTFLSMCVVMNMAVFCRSSISRFPTTLHRYFLNDFDTVPPSPLATGIASVVIFHMHSTFMVRSLQNNLLGLFLYHISVSHTPYS